VMNAWTFPRWKVKAVGRVRFLRHCLFSLRQVCPPAFPHRRGDPVFRRPALSSSSSGRAFPSSGLCPTGLPSCFRLRRVFSSGMKRSFARRTVIPSPFKFNLGGGSLLSTAKRRRNGCDDPLFLACAGWSSFLFKYGSRRRHRLV